MINRTVLLPVNVDAQTAAPASSGPSFLTIAILAGVGYGGYRLYKHFRKG